MPRVHAILPLPAPVNGMTLASKALIALFDDQVEVHGYSNSANWSPRTWSVIRHLLLTLNLMIAAFKSRGRHRVYFVPSAGWGLLVNISHSILLRLAFKHVWLHHHVFSYCRQRDWRMTLFLSLLGPNVNHIVLSNLMAEKLHSNYAAARFVTLNNAPLTTEIGRSPRTRTLPRAVGYLGSNSLEKGLDTAIEAMTALSETSTNYQYFIAGPITDPKLHGMISGFVRDDPENRFFMGTLGPNEKEQFFNQIDVLLFPTRYQNEAQPLTIFEALAHGCPVLATDRGCIPEQLEPLHTCFAESQYISACTNLFAKWAAHPSLFAGASNAARARYREQLDIGIRQAQQLSAQLTHDPV